MSGESLKVMATARPGNRGPGFYWILLSDRPTFEQEERRWVVAEMRDGVWCFAGWPHKWDETSLVQLERLLEVGSRLDPPKLEGKP